MHTTARTLYFSFVLKNKAYIGRLINNSTKNRKHIHKISYVNFVKFINFKDVLWLPKINIYYNQFEMWL